MTAVDWWWTGHNNATDNKPGHRHGYWPPRDVGIICGIFYRIGWVCGKIVPHPR